MILLFIIFSFILLLWLAGFLFVTDFAVPLRDVRQFQRVLVLFPHADDEAITCAGCLHGLAKRGCAVTLVLLTKGERGPNPGQQSNLQEIRTQEAQLVAATLGISRLIQEDFGDGVLCKKKPELTAYIETLIEQEKPDLLITYDLAGFYGHMDHVVCSEIVTNLKKTRFSEVPLWYVTFPKRVLTRIKLPADLTLDLHFQEKQALPTHKIFIGVSVFPKIKAWYTYKSQRASLASGIGTSAAVWFLWFLLSMVLFEYFAEAS
jgi:LmbE family N-acetylglucosaminyl deacetylase